MCTELQTAVLPLWGVSRGGSGNVIGLSAPTPQIQLSLLSLMFPCLLELYWTLPIKLH